MIFKYLLCNNIYYSKVFKTLVFKTVKFWIIIQISHGDLSSKINDLSADNSVWSPLFLMGTNKRKPHDFQKGFTQALCHLYSQYQKHYFELSLPSDDTWEYFMFGGNILHEYLVATRYVSFPKGSEVGFVRGRWERRTSYLN